MADSDVIRKLRVYRALFRLNRAFALIAHNLDQLLIAQVFEEDIPDQDNPLGWRDTLAQIQMEINRQLTENLTNMEHGDIKRLHRFKDMMPKVRKMHLEDAARKKGRR